MDNPFLRPFDSTGHAVLMTWRTLRYMPSVFRQWPRFFEHVLNIGYATMPLVAILSFSIGAVLALQVGYSMRAFAFNEFIGGIVGMAMVRELGPVMTAIMLAGRVGSAITAEMASMKVYQEIDALHVMNIPPERMLIVPRLAATICIMPILTITSIVTGWIGGQMVAQYTDFINLTPTLYYQMMKQFVTQDAILDGLLKAEIFGVLVILITCNIGLRTTGGPREIGRAVTRGVVSCIIVILAANYFVTRFLLSI